MFCRFCGAVVDESVSICPKCGQYATGPIIDSSSGQRKNAGYSGGSFGAGMNQNTSNSGQPNAGYSGGSFGAEMNQNTSNSGQPNDGYSGGSFGAGMNQNTSNSGQPNAGYSGGSFDAGMNQNTSNPGQPNAGYSGGAFGAGMNQNTSNSGQPNAGYQGNPYGNIYGQNQPFTYKRTLKDIMTENCIVTKDGKRLGIEWLKYFTIFGILALIVIFLVNAIFFFSGNLWGNYKHFVHRTEASTQMMDVFFGIVNVCLVIGMIVLWTAIFNLKKYSIALVNCIDTLNLLFVLAFYFYTFNLELSVPVYIHIFNVARVLILLYSSMYLCERRDAFIN